MLNVLYLDHSKLFHRIMHQVVTECGHNFISASKLSDGKEIIAKQKIGLIIMGLEFSDGNVNDFIVAVTRDSPRPIPVIVMSSNDSVSRREEIFALGVFDYILKSDLKPERFSRYFGMLARSDELQEYLRTLKIAVLDDSTTILSFVRTIFELNYLSQGDFFHDPEDFLASKTKYDLYIIDYILPGLSGDTVIESIRHNNPEAIIVCMSAIANDRTLSNALMAGADDYITKPFDADIFMARIKINLKSYLLKEKLKKAAVTDGLTGAFNHAHSFQLLERLIYDANRHNKDLALLMMDIDDFKKLNDTLGHQAGDEALVEISEAIRFMKRDRDIFGRYGGEEFILILPDTGRDKALEYAESVRAKIEGLLFSIPEIHTTVSVGLALLESGERAEKLIGKADAKLYTAKRSGKNRVAI